MVVVIGAGVVGLAVARSIARRGQSVSVVERHAQAGRETSTRNSGVIHAGLYYPPGSLKARLCLDGREPLYAFCAEHGVPHVRCGKLLVAQDGEEASLARIISTAAANGATVTEVDRRFIAAREPNVIASCGLWSPDTGWFDTNAYVRALEADVVQHDGVVRMGSGVIGIEPEGDHLVVVTPRERIAADAVVNAAGLYADDVSRLAGGEAFQIYPCRGEYAALAPRARHLVHGLVYPIPPASGHGLGVHMTRTMSGEVWIGPTVHYQDDKQDYERGRLTVEDFLEPTRVLLPMIQLEDLQLGGSGIRPKLHPESGSFSDFLIARDARNPHLVHAAGIESPGLTASLAIGEMVAAILGG